MVPETQDLVPFLIEEVRPLSISFDLRNMLAPIHFDHKFALQATEVDDASANHMLTPKLGTADLSCP